MLDRRDQALHLGTPGLSLLGLQQVHRAGSDQDPNPDPRSGALLLGRLGQAEGPRGGRFSASFAAGGAAAAAAWRRGGFSITALAVLSFVFLLIIGWVTSGSWISEWIRALGQAILGPGQSGTPQLPQ
jgi:hypothetical protein